VPRLLRNVGDAVLASSQEWPAVPSHGTCATDSQLGAELNRTLLFPIALTLYNRESKCCHIRPITCGNVHGIVAFAIDDDRDAGSGLATPSQIRFEAYAKAFDYDRASVEIIFYVGFAYPHSAMRYPLKKSLRTQNVCMELFWPRPN